MPYIYIPFWVDEAVVEKLTTGEYERKGGIIRRSDNKRIVCWLRQEGEIPEGATISYTLFKIITGHSDVEHLSDEELIELGEFVNGSENLSSFNFYQECVAPVGAVTNKYRGFQREGRNEEAKEYASAKRQAMVNIFARTYIPNLKHQVELDMIHIVEDEGTGLIDYVRRID